METNPNWIVVEDRQGDYWEGAVVDSTRANQLRARNVALLPVIPDLFRVAGIGGFHKRAWGAGWNLNTQVPRIASPMTMFCSKDFRRIYWCARLVPLPEFAVKIEKGVQIDGFLQICGDVSQTLTQKITVTSRESVHAHDTIVKSKLIDGGFLVGGSADAMVPADAPFGFGLFGMMPGLRVAWSAVSQAQI